MKELQQRMDLMQEKHSPRIESYTKADGTPCFWLVFQGERPPFETERELYNLFLLAAPALAKSCGILKAPARDDGNIFKAMKSALK